MQSENQNSKEIVSVAVQVGTETVLYKLNQAESLPVIIETLCSENKIPYELNQYSLQLTDSKNSNDAINKYVTEENRIHITNGSILRLVYSPMEMCRIIHQKIQLDSGSQEDDVVWALEKLSALSRDRTFSEEFVSKYGLLVVTSLIQDIKPPYTVTPMCLETIYVFLQHGLIPNISDIPYKIIVEFVITVQTIPTKIVELSLAILKRILKYKKTSEEIKKYIQTKVNLPEIMPHIWNVDHQPIQENALALINVLASGSSIISIIPVMASEQMRNNLCSNILNNPITHNLAHELYIYQCIVLGLLMPRLNTLVDSNGDEARNLQELNSISYSHHRHIKRDSIVSLIDEGSLDKVQLPTTTTRASSIHELQMVTPLLDKKSKKLANQRSKSATESGEEGDVLTNLEIHTYHQQFASSLEISQLTLDCMLYFARKYLKSYTRILLMEEKVLKKPFHTTCDKLIRLICDVLQVGQQPTKDCTFYQPLFFQASDESPFIKELFCRVAIRLSNTRREMKARTAQDHEKVMKVLRHQMKEALNMQPETWRKLDADLQDWSYEKVSDAWQTEHEKNLLKLRHLPPVIELRQNLKESIEELIRQQRLNVLCEGGRFPKPNTRGQKFKNRYWFIYLSSNHMVFHYGDCTENETDSVECSSKISVSNITDLVTGKKCPHVKDAKNNRKPEPDFAFSLLLDLHLDTSSLDFVAPNQQTFDYWIDGLNVLLGRTMKSKTMETELNNLLDMEVRLELLDIEGINIPHTAPPIPKGPVNYDFVCNK